MKTKGKGLIRLTVMVCMLMLCISAAYADIPDTINYQGYLTDNTGKPVNGTVKMVFKIYTEGDVELWTETHNAVSVIDGIYNVTLGSQASTSLRALSFNQPYLLGITVGGDAEMTPRQALASVAYALTADSALSLNCVGCIYGIQINPDQIQKRVSMPCNEGSSIRFIDQNGGVTCETDNGGTPSGAVTTLDGSSVVGTASEYSRGDHKHGIGTGAITSTHILNSTIVNEDISASAAIAGSKLASDGSVMKSLVPGTNITVNNNNNGSWTINSSGPGNDWSLTGNAGTTPSANFLGTTDNQPLVFAVNGKQAFRIEPNETSPNMIGGHNGNSIAAGVYGASIGGGGSLGDTNRITDNHGTIGGGRSNQAGDNAGTTDDASSATVGGGWNNTASGVDATVCGGNGNFAGSPRSTVGGGVANEASAEGATVGGGKANRASGDVATVGGGDTNAANAWGATVSGGTGNEADGSYATVGGGTVNEAVGSNATVSGGGGNYITAAYGTIGGGG